MSTTAVQPERILRDLQQLWAQMAKDQAESGGVLRACAMTLVVAAEDAADAGLVRQTAGVLMHNHPSRAVILHPGGNGADLDARIFAECWKPFGKAQQICSEGIEITAGQSGFSEVAKFLVPLRVPDLPVVLWCRGVAALDPGPLEPLFALADKIIFDSLNVADADSALQFLRRLRGRVGSKCRVADLNWKRLTGWREVFAHLFDDGALQPGDVKAAQVTFGGPMVTTATRYFAAWIRTALPAVRVTMTAGEGPAGLRAVTLSTASDQLTIARSSDTCVEVSGCGRRYQSMLPSASEEALMQEELGILGPDEVYERALKA